MSPLLRAFLRGQVFSAPPASALEWDCRVPNLTRGAARLILHRGCCPLPPAVREGSRFSMCRQHTFSRLLFYCGRPGGCEVFQRDTDSYFPHPETLTTFPRLLSICVSFFFFLKCSNPCPFLWQVSSTAHPGLQLMTPRPRGTHSTD